MLGTDFEGGFSRGQYVEHLQSGTDHFGPDAIAWDGGYFVLTHGLLP
jgi:hypothetical protein